MNPVISAYVKARIAIANRFDNLGDKGAGFVEYAGVLLVVGAIAAAVVGFGGELGETIKTNISDAIDKAFNFEE